MENSKTEDDKRNVNNQSVLKDKTINFSKELNDIINLNLYEIKDTFLYKQKKKDNKIHYPQFKKKKKKIIRLKKETNNNEIESTFPSISQSVSFNNNIINYYIIIPGNNKELIKNCLDTRENWKEIPEENIQKNIDKCQLFWSPLSSDINFNHYSYFIWEENKFTNHFEYHSSITNKLFLFYNLLKYCEQINKNLFSFYPFTIPIDSLHFSFKEQINALINLHKHIKDYIGIKNEKKKTYSELFYLNSPNLNIGFKTKVFFPKNFYDNRNLWLLKPTNLNGGKNIIICNSIEKINSSLNNNINDNNNNSHLNDISNNNLNDTEYENKKLPNKIIIQKYLEKPLLYDERKFDVRIWVLLNHEMNVYICKEGHLKISSEKFSIENNDLYVHLTNYTVQKTNPNFSKFEKGNEISFDYFQQSLNQRLKEQKKENINFRKDVLPKMKDIIMLTMESVKHIINEKNRKNCFELFGYDFIFDQNLTPYLLEINTNPGLEESSPFIQKIVPRMIDDLFKLTIDKIYYPVYKYKNNDKFEYPFKVNNYNDNENIWELIGNIQFKKKYKSNLF